VRIEENKGKGENEREKEDEKMEGKRKKEKRKKIGGEVKQEGDKRIVTSITRGNIRVKIMNRSSLLQPSYH
jgi:hypothetical protein